MVKYSYQKVATVVVLFLNIGLVLLSLSSSVVEGQRVCNMSEEELEACRPSVTPPNPTKPTPKCCSAVSHADLVCLCRYKSSSIPAAFGVDPKLAIKLPLKCGLPHPAPC